MNATLPPELLSELLARHRAGQSDPALVRWLASLTPPIVMSRVGVLKARGRAAAEAGQVPTAEQPRRAAPVLRFATKPSGAAGAKLRAERDQKEASDHARRSAVTARRVAAETRPERAHLYTLEVLLDLQREIYEDAIMTPPERVRYLSMLAQAMAKIRGEAELERRIVQLEAERATEAQALLAARHAVDIESKRLDARRRELEEGWRRLSEHRAAAGVAG